MQDLLWKLYVEQEARKTGIHLPKGPSDSAFSSAGTACAGLRRVCTHGAVVALAVCRQSTPCRRSCAL